MLVSLIFLSISLFINFYANVYTTLRASNYVSDIILDNIPVFNVDFFFIEGFVLLWVYIAYLLLKTPNNIPFVVKSIALFILIRSIFITMTHIAPPLNHLQIDPQKIILDITSGNDLFFSSHTGLPLLIAFIYWENKRLRTIFLAATGFFAMIVLLAHLHYTIDVFGALFITFTIYHMALKFFPQDNKIFEARDIE